MPPLTPLSLALACARAASGFPSAPIAQQNTQIEQNLSGLLNLLPDRTDELLQRVDQPLEEVSKLGPSMTRGGVVHCQHDRGQLAGV